MIKIIACVVFILHLHFAHAQVREEPIPNPFLTRSSKRPRTSDPVSNFLSGLGNLFMDFDETFTKQVAPKVDSEDRMKEQMYGRPRSGPNYFNRIRENYRDVQKRLGESVGKLDLRMSSELGSVNVQNQGPESFIDVSFPFLPMQLAVKSNRGLKASDYVNGITESTNIEPEKISPQISTSLKLGNSEINVDSKFDPLQPSELLKNVENQIKKALEDITLTNAKNNPTKTEDVAQEKGLDTIPKLESGLNLNSNEFSSRSGSEVESSETSEDYSSPEGRILGDVLYSESTFDQLTKRVMKDSKWAIDPKLFPSRAVEKLKKLTSRVTESAVSTDVAPNQSPEKVKDETIYQIPQPEKQNIKKRKSLKPFGNGLETVLTNEITKMPKQDGNSKFGIQDGKRQKDSFILAFTPDGVPLKLRMGPEVKNPLKFLHKSLVTYGVSLNIPVASYNDIEPVAREVLQLGTGSGGTMTRALYIDLSDSFQLESLLRTLKSTKMIQEMQSEGVDGDL